MKQGKYMVTVFCSSFSDILGPPSVTQHSFVQSQETKGISLFVHGLLILFLRVLSLVL